MVGCEFLLQEQLESSRPSRSRAAISEHLSPAARPGGADRDGASTTSVTVSWTAPTNTGKPDISDYDVKFRASGATNWTAHSFTGTGVSTTISRGR